MVVSFHVFLTIATFQVMAFALFKLPLPPHLNESGHRFRTRNVSDRNLTVRIFLLGFLFGGVMTCRLDVTNFNSINVNNISFHRLSPGVRVKTSLANGLWVLGSCVLLAILLLPVRLVPLS